MGRSDKKEFAKVMGRRMKGRGGQAGVSYQSILSYFDGSSTPSLEWINEAADELGVLPSWLAFDQGPKTQAEERTRAQVEAAAGSDRLAEMTPRPEELRQAFLEGLPALAHASPASWHALAELHVATNLEGRRRDLLAAQTEEGFAAAGGREASDRYRRKGDIGFVMGDPDMDEMSAIYHRASRAAELSVARDLAEAVGASARSLEIDLVKCDRWEVDRFVQITVQALLVLTRRWEEAAAGRFFERIRQGVNTEEEPNA